ncbi:unnamed protein product [Somion occarium]|uniref:amidase n=1 Tax=Somion occarium TaxID=3059160 RepID=A0ABP1CK86_9APHY
MPDGIVPSTLTPPPAIMTECSQPALWKNISDRKVADRKALLDQWPDWHLQEVTPESIKDISKIPISHLTAREYEIVHLDATGLVEAIRDRRYTSIEVLWAFCHVATIAQDLTNCLTEVFFGEGLKRAAELDKHLEETGEVVGPLHGLPISIKDHIMVKGHDTATGYIAWAYKTVASKDAVAVDILKKAGAVLYVKTANPQTLLALETNNNIYGRTSNPFNRSLTPGGSSGGESALIALHGSPMGIGTDIGGSIRIPAAHCGLYGLKGSVARMPHAGLMGSHDGMDAIIGALGPIATSARDLALFCRVMLQYQPWLIEPPLIEIPWKQEVVDGQGIPKRLSIAILWDDGVVKPHPPVLDALKRTKDALIRAGHEVIVWESVDHQESWDLLVRLPDKTLFSRWRRRVPNGGNPFTVAEIFKINLAREAFRAKITAHWNATEARTSTGRQVDAVLSPVAPTLAPPHDSTSWWGYTSYWNLMDFPGAVFPVDRFYAQDYRPLDISSDIKLPSQARNDTEKIILDQWDPAIYDNAPVCLQLVGRRLNEEKVLGMMQVVESAIGSARSGF